MVTNKTISISDRLFGKKPCYCTDAITGLHTAMGNHTKKSCKQACKGLRPTKYDNY